MDDKKMITIQNIDGTSFEVQLLTYLTSDNSENKYIVYSKGEKVDNTTDQIIYVSKLVTGDDGKTSIVEIVDDNEWADVQKLLKKVANV